MIEFIIIAFLWSSPTTVPAPEVEESFPVRVDSVSCSFALVGSDSLDSSIPQGYVRVHGYIRSGYSKRVIAVAFFSPRGANKSYFTDENGHYECLIPAGELSVMGSGLGYTPAMESIEAMDQHDIQINFYLLDSPCGLYYPE